ncbi:MAG: FIST N-terminal domain-containing protein, partial [Cyanobium sp.]
MKVCQQIWNQQSGWRSSGPILDAAQLVLVFAGINQFGDMRWLAELRTLFPVAQLFGCSTAGEIAGTEVNDETVVATGIHFETTTIHLERVTIRHPQDSRDAGHRLASLLPKDKLAHVLVIADGQRVNGSELVRGLTADLPAGVHVTGGLAGDG